MVALAPSSQNGSSDDMLEALELALEAIDGLRAQVDQVAEVTAAVPAVVPPDERPDRLLTEVGRLHRRVEEIAEATWRESENDRIQRALDAIDRLRIRVDDADVSETVLRTLDLVSSVAARLDIDDGVALAELTLEAVEGLRQRVDDDRDDWRTIFDRASANLDELRREIETRDPAEALELALEAMDDVGRRVDDHGDAIQRRLETMETSLTGLAELAAALAGAVAELAAAAPPAIEPPPIDDAAVAAIADRVAGALMGRVELAIGVSTDRVLGRVDASTDRVLGRVDASTDRLLGRLDSPPTPLPSGDHGAAVVASAAAAMLHLEGRLDTEFGSVEQSVDRLDRHLAELKGLVRGSVTVRAEPRAPNGTNRPAPADMAAKVKASANGLLASLKVKGRAVRR